LEFGMRNADLEVGKQKTSVEQMAEVRQEEEQVRGFALIEIVENWDKERVSRCLHYFLV